PLAAEAARAVRPQKQPSTGRENAPKLAQARRNVVLGDVLEHVVGDDEIERLLPERQLPKRSDEQVGLRNTCPRDLDRRRGDVDAGSGRERPGVERPAEEPAGAA